MMPLTWFLLLPAKESLATDSTSPELLMMWQREGAERIKLVVKAVESQLVDLDVHLRSVTISKMPRTLARQIGQASDHLRPTDAMAICWCDFSARAKVYFYYHESGEARLLVRELTEPDWASRAEAVAVIVRASVREILAGVEIGRPVEMALEKKKTAWPVPSPARPNNGVNPGERAREGETPPLGSRERGGPDILVTYVLYAHNRQLSLANGLGLGLAYFFRPFLGFWVQYLVMQQLAAEREELSLRLGRHPLGAGFRVLIGRGAFQAGGSAGILVDFARFHVASRDYELKKSADNMDVVISGVLALEVSYALFDRVSFFFSGGLEMTFNRISYKAKLGNVEETVIKPFPVHPLIHLGFLVSLF